MWQASSREDGGELAHSRCFRHLPNHGAYRMGAVKCCPDCAQRFPGKLARAGVLASVSDLFGLKVFWTSEVEEAFDSGTVRFPDF